ncbi:globin [Leptospira kirschneri]|nr:globin [Leptospira kirschneri]OOV48417.1 globin [Leptospira kirschneri serovar Grippotyphosa]UZW36798.1 globin [Leptospira kirschneri]WBF95150.1 globin [Leptospira kirschneri]WHP00500.1 globin [Leptospira kirschneri]
MNISENQIRSLNESFDIVNLDRIKFAELFFIYLKENHPKYENIFSRIQLEDVKHFMNSARNISLSSVQYSQLEKAIQNFGVECLKICNQVEEIPILEKAWLFALEEWLGPWYSHEVEKSWQEVFKMIHTFSESTLQISF